MRQRHIQFIVFGLAGTFIVGCASSKLDEEGSETHFQCSANQDCRIIDSRQACIEGECKVVSTSGCVPGQSIACVGPGGCAGGQVCSADGTKYGACDCGGTESGTATVFATIPPRPDPSVVVNRDTVLPEMVVVLRAIDFGDRDPTATTSSFEYREMGLDVDHHVTTADDLTEGECQLPQGATGLVDGPGGIDNALGAIWQGFRTVIGDFTSDNYSAQLERGSGSLAIRVNGFNGEANDDQVTVDVLATARFDAFSRDADASTPALPVWDGTDIWPVTSDSVTDPTSVDALRTAKISDATGYVTEKKLVALLPAMDLRQTFELADLAPIDLDFSFSDAGIVCDVVDESTSAGFGFTNCTVAGRWVADALLHQLSHFPDPNPPEGRVIGSPVCTDSPMYTIYKENICGSIDVFQTMPTAPVVCNALSVGFKFQTAPALLGEIFFSEPLLPRCPSEIEPSNDSCASPDASTP